MESQHLHQLLSLPLPERIELAQALWHSIHDASVGNIAAERECIDLAADRDADLTSNPAIGKSHDQVMQAARRVLECG